MTSESFREFANCLREPVLLVSATGELLSLNAAAARLLGLSADAGLLHARLADFLHGGGGAIDDFVRACSRSSQVIFASISLRTPSGGEQPFRAEGILYPKQRPGDTPAVFLRLMPREAATAPMTSIDERLRALAVAPGGPPRLVSIADLASRAAAMIRPLAGDTEILVRNQADPPAVLVDPGVVERVLVQLAVHATHAAFGAGPVVFETARADDEGGPWATITCRFPGAHLDEAQLAHLFEPPVASDDGTGISLASCRSSIVALGGQLLAASSPSGRLLTVLLPAAAGTDHTPHQAEAATRVLVVDDDDLARDLMSDALASAGFQVMSAPSGTVALEIAAGRVPIDLLVTDVIMPRLTGPNLARTLREGRPALRVLYVSGFTARNDLSLDPASAFLAKPFTRGTFLGRVRALIEA